MAWRWHHMPPHNVDCEHPQSFSVQRGYCGKAG
jgi:hypothetical protein